MPDRYTPALWLNKLQRACLFVSLALNTKAYHSQRFTRRVVLLCRDTCAHRVTSPLLVPCQLHLPDLLLRPSLEIKYRVTLRTFGYAHSTILKA